MFRTALLALAVGLLPFGSARAAKNGTLAEAVDAIAEDAQKFLANKDEKTVTVGSFTGIGDVANLASSGPTICRELAARLAAKQVAVQPRGKFTLVGEFGEVEDKATERQAVEIKWKLVVTKDRTVAFESQTPQFVLNEEGIANLLGLNLEQDPQGSKEDRNRKIKEAVDKPKPALAATRIQADAKSPFAIEILTAPANHPRAGQRTIDDYRVQTPKVDQGFAFVPIARDQVFAVKLENAADFDAAVDLRVDGLSMYTFSGKEFRDKTTDQPIFRYVVVPKGKSVLIRGWHVTNDDSDEFLVTSYAKSAAGQLGSTANLGTITAGFHAAWPKRGTPPADEPKNPAEFAQSADAIGRGKRFEQKYEAVEVEVGVLRAAISARYSK